MVLVTDTQAQTISPQAADYLRSAGPIQIPGPQLTQADADQLNNELEAQIGPLLEQLRTILRLDVENQTVGGTPVVVITPHAVKPDRRTVAGVFAHGGGWALLTGNDYNAYRMAHDLGIVVYSVDYSRSPRVQFPIALRETFAAYHAVSQNHRKVVVAGSSAGANLLITTILKARRGEARPPKAAGLFTPLVDLRSIGDSYVANDGRDPLITRDTITKIADAYLGTISRADPAASPSSPTTAAALCRPFSRRAPGTCSKATAPASTGSCMRRAQRCGYASGRGWGTPLRVFPASRKASRTCGRSSASLKNTSEQACPGRRYRASDGTAVSTISQDPTAALSPRAWPVAWLGRCLPRDCPDLAWPPPGTVNDLLTVPAECQRWLKIDPLAACHAGVSIHAPLT